MVDFTKYKNMIHLPKKEKEQEEKNSVNVDSQIRRHRILLFYKYFAVLSILTIIGIIAYVKWKNKVYSEYEVISAVQWEKNANTQSIPLSDNIFTYSKDGMNCTDPKGNVLWNVTYEMQNPIVRTCKDIVAIGDYNGRKIYVCNKSKSLGQIDTTIPIRDFCVSANGVVAAVLDDTTVTAIQLYDVNGKEIAYFKTTMSKSGYPLALGISDNSEMVAISYLQAGNGTVSSNVAFYNFSSVGQNYTDNLVGGYGYADAIVPFVAFLNEDTVVAVADNRIMFYQGDQTPTNIADVVVDGEIQGIYYSNQLLGVVYYDPNEETSYRLDLYDKNGKLQQSISFSMEYTDILIQNNSIIIFNESECAIYTIDGKLKYQGQFHEAISSIIPTNSLTRYTLITDHDIQTIELK